MSDFEKMTIVELREAILKEHTSFIKSIDSGDSEDLQKRKDRITLLMELVNKKLKENKK